MPWSPLAMGMLAGRYAHVDQPPPDSRVAQKGDIYAERLTQRAISTAKQFADLAEAWGFSPPQLALLWVKEQPGVTAPIIGPRTEEHLDVALSVLDLQLDPQINRAVDQIVSPGSAVANFFNSSGWMKQETNATAR